MTLQGAAVTCGQRCARSWPSDPAALVWLLVALIMGEPVRTSEAHDARSRLAFLQAHCVDCHEGADAEAGLDLTTLGEELSSVDVQRRWVRIWDRVHDGEMPPGDGEKPPGPDLEAFLTSTGTWIRDHQTRQNVEFGRVHARRLTRREIERSLQDLLGIDIPLADQLPEEARSSGFTTVANGQSMSHFQMARQLAVVDEALDEAFRRALSEEDHYERDFDAKGVARQDPRRRTREPEMRKGQAVVWSSGLTFYGRLPATTAPASGWYRFAVTVSALKPPESGGVWSTVNTGLCVSSAPLLSYVTSFEATPEPKRIEFEAWLPQGHMLEIRPGDITLKKGRFEGGQVGVGEGEPQNLPGIAIDRITMKRIHHGGDNALVRKLMFENLAVEPQRSGRSMRLVSETPNEDATRLVKSFAVRAFRRPVSDEEIAGYARLALDTIDQGEGLVSALRAGCRAILCSPRFLYLAETPGKLDDFSVAARLSYFLTGSSPDERLRELAASGRLSDPTTIHAETDRLLAGEGGRRFIEDFAAEWLDLDQIDFTEPDRKLFPEFDAIVQNSMLNETRTYLQAMLEEDLPVTRLIDGDFTFLNSRLARFYGMPGVEDDALRRVRLRTEDHRGGVLTQGAILKVTANGSNTSPVVRGVWVSERLLGVPIPPPPGSVPAIEPDIRGAKTIREQLAKHRSQESCAVCHTKIDPPGFALENFDPAGQWRDKYLQIAGGRREKTLPVDASYVLADGRKFCNVDEFRSLIASDSRRLATNVAEKLLVYGTGAPISFADRDAVEQIADVAQEDGYGFRSIIHAVVASPVFLSK